MGPWEIGLIVLIILIVFGVGKLPQVGEEEKEADENPEPKKII